jgi:hypothetical protein
LRQIIHWAGGFASKGDAMTIGVDETRFASTPPVFGAGLFFFLTRGLVLA